MIITLVSRNPHTKKCTKKEENMFIENSNHEIIILCDYGRHFVVLTTYCVHTYHNTSIKKKLQQK